MTNEPFPPLLPGDDEPDAAAERQIRIAGLGGAALVIEPVPVFVRGGALETVRVGVDISLIDPTRQVRYIARPIDVSGLRELAGFLWQATTAPEASLDTLSVGSAGLMLSIPGSQDQFVDIHVEVQLDDGNPPEFDGMQFTTTRAGLWGAAQAAQAAVDDGDPDRLPESGIGPGGT